MAEAMPLPAQMGDMSAEMAAVNEMRGQVSPTEVNSEMLMAAEQADPIAVSEFRRELEEMEIPPEVISLLDAMVDEVLADPANYAAIRQRYMAQGVDEELLPEAFDAQLFGALQVALDQMRPSETMTPPQNFAKGGVASLRPMAQAMADAGRNGDTMVAHISPVEARILKRIGGSGTTNPTTGMPEFFLKKLFKKIGKTVKKFANTTIGKIVIGTALFMTVGAGAASMFGSTAAPALAAATKGFVAGAGTSLLGGRNLKDSLKAGAIGAVTAGAVSGVTQGASAFKPTTPTLGAPVRESIAAVDNTAALPDLSATAAETVATGVPMPMDPFAASPTGMPVAVQGGVASLPQNAGVTADMYTNAVSGSPAVTADMYTNAVSGSPAVSAQTAALTPPPTFGQNVKDIFLKDTLPDSSRFDSFKNAFSPTARKAASADNALLKTMKQFPEMSKEAILTADSTSAVGRYLAANTPGIISDLAPAAIGAMGIAGLSGAFSPEQPQLPPGYEGFMDAPGQRLLEQYPERYGLSFGGVNTMSQTAPYQTYRPYGAATGGSTSDFPRKNGAINGPGTGTSDDIPAMLSDGEFVFTAKAVRNMGNGSRRKGAKKMYALMKNLEGRANG
ncbi:MAG: hypothetical protein CMA72_06335 [Euryarchaeota archaeon]|nr:hypothetical protein [Euryarchaeota archaeon]